ncbi:MAG: dicarboxylate/amino acid:cation symporter [Pirellulaceae bacterium]
MNRLALHWQILIGMIVGAAIGITLNVSKGTREHSVSTAELPSGLSSLEFADSPSLIRISYQRDDGSPIVEIVIDGTRKTEGALTTVEQLKEHDKDAARWFHQYGRSPARRVGDASKRLGGLFLRLLRMVAVPLIVTSLLTGVTGLGHAGRLGKMFGRTLTYYLATSMIAITIGVFMVNVVRPGLQDNVAPAKNVVTDADQTLGELLFAQLETMIPSNPFAALADSSFLSIISFTLAFGIFAVIVGGRTLEIIREFFDAAFDVMMALTMAIIKLAPFGVLFLMTYVTATQGPAVFKSLFWYMLTVLLALGCHALIVLPAILHFIAKKNPLHFAQAMSPALLTAFSSASSNGTLPLTMACVEKRAGVSNRVSSFVLPLGATINMDGTALYEAVAVLFISQMYHGAVLPLDQQIVVALTALLASVGAAGIPHAGLVMMVIILQAVNLPVEMQGIILAVDRVLDMCRTSVNVWSDSCGCAVVARLEARGSAGSVEGKPSVEGEV